MSNDRLLTLNYDDLSDYTYNANHIQTNGVSALLKLIDNPGQEFEQDFSSDVGFTYDSDKLEFSGGTIIQIAKNPDNSELGATYTGSLNLSWKSDATSLLGTVYGTTPSLSGGKMLCDGSKGIYYLSSLLSTGTIKFKYTPSYTGIPSSAKNLIAMTSNVNPNNSDNYFVLNHHSSGEFKFSGGNSAGGNIVPLLTSIGSIWSPVAGTEYEIEFSWDASGHLRLFIDGTLWGSLTPSAWTFNASVARLYIGANPKQYGVADGLFDDVVKFDNVQHTTSYTPAYNLPEYLYENGFAQLPAFEYSGIGTIQSIDDLTIVESGNPRWIIGGLYWDGSAWVTSDGTYFQANDSADLTNILTYPVEGEGSVVVSIIFDNSNTAGVVSYFGIEITGQAYPTTSPSIYKTIGTYLDGIGELEVNSSEPADTSLSYIVIDNNVQYYHDGSAWVTSNGSQAQSNTLAEFNGNIGDFDFNPGKIFQLKILFNTTDSSKTPTLTSIEMTYDFAVSPSYPTTCKVYGFLTDLSGQPISGAIISFLASDFYSGLNLVARDVKVTSDANGYYESDLVISDNQVTHSVSYTDVGGNTEEYEDKIIIPDQEVASIVECLVS